MKPFPRRLPILETAAVSLLLALLALPAPPARAAGEAQLQSVQVLPLPNGPVQLRLQLSAAPPRPLSFTMDHPARIVIDLRATRLALPSDLIPVKSGGLESILAAESKHRSRLVLTLARPIPYRMKRLGNDILVTLGAASDVMPAASAAAPTPLVSTSPAPAAGTGPIRQIRSIDFRRTPGGAGKVIVQLSNPHIPVNLRQLGDHVIVDFTGAAVPVDLLRRFDATDFGTPVIDFEVTRTPTGSRITIHGTGAFNEMAYQANTQYVVELRPVSQAQALVQKPRYTGQRLSLNFQDIPVRAVLQLLADASGKNIVVSGSVKGSLTLRLHNVPWDQALHLILQIKGLGEEKQGNVILVAPQAELADREKAQLAAQRAVQQLVPLRSEYLQINYAKAADLAALIKSQGNSLLSKRGTVSVDKRTNTLLLQDTPQRLAQINRLVKRLDVPVRQVLIEARIVLVNNDFERKLGSQLGLTHWTNIGSSGIGVTTGTSAGESTMIGSAIGNINGGANPSYQLDGAIGSSTNAANRYDINLPVSNPAGSIAFGILTGNYLLDLELSAAQAQTQAKIVSSPKVITADQKQATIMQGIEIPYQQSASSGATSISFKKAVLELKVTPQITPDNHIILNLHVRDDQVGQTFVSSGGVDVPAIDTRRITTQVLVDDGQTVVLGGILQTTSSNVATKVPWLGDIPILGHLFKNTDRTNDKDELLVFITPKIIQRNLSMN